MQNSTQLLLWKASFWASQPLGCGCGCGWTTSGPFSLVIIFFHSQLLAGHSWPLPFPSQFIPPKTALHVFIDNVGGDGDKQAKQFGPTIVQWIVKYVELVAMQQLCHVIIFILPNNSRTQHESKECWKTEACAHGCTKRYQLALALRHAWYTIMIITWKKWMSITSNTRS